MDDHAACGSYDTAADALAVARWLLRIQPRLRPAPDPRRVWRCSRHATWHVSYWYEPLGPDCDFDAGSFMVDADQRVDDLSPAARWRGYRDPVL